MKKYEFSSSLSGVTEIIEADAFYFRDNLLAFNRNGEISAFAAFLVGPGSFVREIKESDTPGLVQLEVVAHGGSKEQRKVSIEWAQEAVRKAAKDGPLPGSAIEFISTKKDDPKDA